MTPEEISYKFDLLYNNIMSDKAPGLNYFEKSMFLTKAADDLSYEYYKGYTTDYKSFDESEDLRRYLGNLIKIKTYEIVHGYYDNEKFFTDPQFTNVIPAETGKYYCDIPSSVLYTYSEDTDYEECGNYPVISLPEDLMFIIQESATLFSENSCINGKKVEVVPALYDEESDLSKNPFKKGNKSRALRFDRGTKEVELVTTERVSKYIVKYLRDPEPIILEDLPDGITIKGKSKKSSGSFDSIFHEKIIQRAVQLAQISYKS